MTDQEALKYLKDANRNNQMVGVLPKSDIGKCLINALEENQKYRAVGAPEECRAVEWMSRVLPILFNTDMVRAILDGRKTVTRRLIKPQPTYSQCDGFTWKGGSYGTDLPPTIKGAAYNFRCAAPYHPGDILYVRETWGTYNRNWREADYFMHRADYPDGATTYMYNDGIICDLPKWRPSIHMPKEAARIWLKVKDVRVERLKDIDDAGAYDEGAGHADWIYQNGARRCEFAKLWNSTIKKSDLDSYGWDANPWVWVIEFELCEKPEGWCV